MPQLQKFCMEIRYLIAYSKPWLSVYKSDLYWIFPSITDSQSTSATLLKVFSSPCQSLIFITASLGQIHCLLSQSMLQLTWSFYLQKHKNHSADLQIVTSKEQPLHVEEIRAWLRPRGWKVGYVCEENFLAPSPPGYVCNHQAKCKLQQFFSKQQKSLTESGPWHRLSTFLTQKQTTPLWIHYFTHAFRFGPPELRIQNCLTYFSSLWCMLQSTRNRSEIIIFHFISRQTTS